LRHSICRKFVLICSNSKPWIQDLNQLRIDIPAAATN